MPRMAYRCTTGDPAWKAVDEARESKGSAGRFSDMLRDAPLPAAIIQVEKFAELWDAVEDKCRELVPGPYGGSRSAGEFDSTGNGCSVVLSREQEDGTSRVWHVRSFALGGTVSTRVKGPWTDNHDAHWEKLLADGGDYVVAGHRVYFFSTADDPKGFGGRAFTFRMLGSGTVRTHDSMWFAGVVPPAWRERIPDTAEMVRGFPPAFAG